MTTVSLSAAAEALVGSAPLVAAWREFADADTLPFTIPGHKGRAGSLSPTLGRIVDSDVPLYGGLDTPKLERGVLAQAERLAAQGWGADWCRFSTGGATHANQLLALAAGRPGQAILVARTAHRSVLMGLVLAGLRPVWLPVEVDDRSGLTTGVSAPTVRQALREQPGAVALWVVEPGYTGAVSPDLPACIEAAHAAGLAVIVDQAWGAHFGFHPAYPAHALHGGADAVVMSAHKTLPAISQAAYVAARGDRFDPAWLDRCFDACATTSPAGSILASLDGARAILQSPVGVELLESVRVRVAGARDRLRAAGMRVPDPADFPPGCYDPAKLVIQTTGWRPDGLGLERALRSRGISVEMADRATLVPMIGLLDDDSTIEALVDAIVDQLDCGGRSGAGPGGAGGSTWSLPSASITVPALSPREAFYAPRRPVRSVDAVGRICAELVAPYPPGVPVLLPGEVVTELSLETLRAAADAGSRIAYAADPSLATVLVVDEAAPEREPGDR